MVAEARAQPDRRSGPGAELEELRARLEAAEETLRAIRAGEVDAVVVEGPGEPQVYTLRSAAEPYRLLVERMAQGALTVSPDGLILFCNDSFAGLIDQPRERLYGARLTDHVAPEVRERLLALLRRGEEPGREIALCRRNGEIVEAYLTAAPLAIDGDDLRCLVVTDLSRQELRLRHAAVVEASDDPIYALSDDLVIRTWNRGAEALTGLAAAEAIGRSEWTLWSEGGRARLERLLRRVAASGGPASIDIARRRRDGSRAELVYTLTPLKDRGDRIAGYSVVAHDITARKETERRLRFLSAEVDHRAKNMLAMVQAIADLSSRTATGMDDFLAAFQARIQAMSVAHTLLSDNRWSGASVAGIIEGTLAGFRGDDRIRLSGCDAVLRPRAAQDLALALHELAINATKYGSLSVLGGRVEVDRRREGAQLVIEWREIGGPAVAAPTRQGLGAQVIRHGAGIKGTVDHRFDADGVRCIFTLGPESLVR